MIGSDANLRGELNASADYFLKYISILLIHVEFSLAIFYRNTVNMFGLRIIINMELPNICHCADNSVIRTLLNTKTNEKC